MPFLNGTVGVIFREYAMGVCKSELRFREGHPVFSWFSLYFFEARKVTRSPQGSETTAVVLCDKIAASAAPPRNDTGFPRSRE